MAHREFFGDSYGIVAQSLLRCLSKYGTWAGLPMFTENNVPQPFVEQYKRFLGLSHIITCERAPAEKGRGPYFSQAKSFPGYHNVFIDPDTGLTLRPDKETRQHLKAEELVRITKSRHIRLVLVYDQSIDRGIYGKGMPAFKSAAKQLNGKLIYLRKRRVYGFAYCSHTSFILVSRRGRTILNAKRWLQICLKLPTSRLVSLHGIRRRSRVARLTRQQRRARISAYRGRSRQTRRHPQRR